MIRRTRTRTLTKDDNDDGNERGRAHRYVDVLRILLKTLQLGCYSRLLLSLMSLSLWINSAREGRYELRRHPL
jgi:hypothetical protein